VEKASAWIWITGVSVLKAGKGKGWVFTVACVVEASND
jgi:hypothetical protein